MTEKKKYPEEIYPKRKTEKTAFGIMESWHSTNLDYERAYDLGFRDGRFKERLEASNPLAGWSNLTEAIEAGERIDWERLDGLEAQCVHSELGALTHKLVRDQPEPPDGWAGWGTKETELTHWDTIFECAWAGSSGWSLWVKGDLPLRKRTADELEPGTCFRARYEKNGETHNYAWAQLLKPSGQKPRVIFLSQALTTLFGSALPEDVEVVDAYGVGTFPTPEGDA